jgi:hypothetical protein
VSAGEPAGGVREEAARLFEALQDFASAQGWTAPPGADRATGTETGTGTGADAAAAGATPHGGPECRYCPVCQLIAVVRGTRPEVAAHLAEAAGALLEALRAAVVAHEREWSAPPGRGVERIDIG